MKKVYLRALILLVLPFSIMATQIILEPGFRASVEPFNPENKLSPMPEDTLELIRDENTATWAYSTQTGDRWAVMFTPPQYPFNLLYAGYAPVTWSDDTAGWHAECDLVFFSGDSTDGPTSEFGRITDSATAEGEWNWFDVSSLNIEITSGSFFFAVEYLEDYNPGIWLDGVSPEHHVSWLYGNVGGTVDWYPFDALSIDGMNLGDTFDIMLRVVGEVPGDQLLADFSADPRTGPAALTVQFSDMSSGNPTEWEWDFGDGYTSTTQDPNKVYADPGNYTVSLTVSDGVNEDTETKTDFIVVGEPSPPTAAFSADPTSGPAPLSVTFSDESTANPTSWLWDFGDGSSNETTQNPTHLYNDPGTYSVTLTATNTFGSDDTTRTDYINVGSAPDPVTANFTANPTTGTAPLTVTFSDQSTGNPDSWEWSFGDGQISTQQNPSHEYTDPGNYDVELIATRGTSTSTNYDSDTLLRTGEITVNAPNPPVAGFTADPSSGYVPFTHRMTVSFTDTSTGDINNRSWNFGDGSTSTEQNPTHTYTSSGTFDVQLIVSGADGADTATNQIVLADVPSAYFALSTLASASSNEVEIRYGIPKQSKIEILLYNVNGELIRHMLHEEVAVGEYITTWNLKDNKGIAVSPGVYFVKIFSDDKAVASSKVVITR
ncbi:PKD domain-containing protein [candidate division WOR-3 bacterium]|nr:PKD domain-containing protein [candidate division WOR-3 bacterium]